MNFALVLVICAFVSGVIYLLDTLLWKKKRTPQQKQPKILEYAESFFPIFLIVLLLRSFLVEPFRIPSGSLEPTLQVGDFVAVNKFIYGLKLPVLETQLLPVTEPKVGDIVVFRWPPNPSFDFIKRVVAVPGDTLSYHNKVLTLNGKTMEQTFVAYTTDESSGAVVAEYSENINGHAHKIYLHPDAPAIDFNFTIPPGYYFMMGDNRDDSADSRFWGLVPASHLRGKAFMVWMSWNGKTDRIRWSNIGHIIQ